MTAGIYRIRNRVTGEVYIGSTFNVYQRVKAHISNMRSNRHENRGLREAWKLYGLKGFAFSILETTERTDTALLQAEQRWMERLSTGTVQFYNRGSARQGRNYNGMGLCCCPRCLERRRPSGGPEHA